MPDDVIRPERGQFRPEDGILLPDGWVIQRDDEDPGLLGIIGEAMATQFERGGRGVKDALGRGVSLLAGFGVVATLGGAAAGTGTALLARDKLRRGGDDPGERSDGDAGRSNRADRAGRITDRCRESLDAREASGRERRRGRDGRPA